jgi:hypothetical protein
MQRISFLFLLAAFSLTSCSSSVSVQDHVPAKGKKIGIGNFKMQSSRRSDGAKGDTVCACVSQSIQKTLLPYLQQAGFNVITLPLTSKTTAIETLHIADSLQVDYIMTAIGLVNIQGSSTFVRELSVKAVGQSGEVAFSASFTGVATGAETVAGKIGKQLVKKLK